MIDLWRCVNCDSIVNLDRHGRCSVCQSDAVLRRSLEHLALLTRLWPQIEAEEVMELERLYKR
jgi:hypothetical protein